MKRILTSSLAVLLVFGLIQIPARATISNIVGNSGFEYDIGNGTEHNWDATNGAVRVTNATLPPGFSPIPEGGFALRIDNTFAFTFQTYDNIKPGDPVTFRSLVESSVVGPASGGQIKIEFKQKNPDGSDTFISSVASVLLNTGNVPAGGGYKSVEIGGIAPPGTGRVVFVLASSGGGAGNIIFDGVQGTVNNNAISLSAQSSKRVMHPGEMSLITAHVENNLVIGNQTIHASGLELVVEPSPGLNIRQQVNSINGTEEVGRNGAYIFPLGDFAPGQNKDFAFPAILTSGARPGKSYQIKLYVQLHEPVPLGGGLDLPKVISNEVILRIPVEPDPVFDQGTIIGKVFNDTNKNGIQDKGETGIPFVRLVTEEGIVIITDEDGKYHIPAVKPGRHLVKIDGHTLPEGTKFITEESFLVHTTAGLMSKANFAVLLPPSSIPEQFQKDLTVMVTQGLDTSRPVLDVAMDPELLKVGVGVLEKEPLFRFKVNYGDFVKKWFLEVRDEEGHPLWTGFGVGVPPQEVPWSGQMESGLLIKPGLYSYRFKVENKNGQQDWTVLHFFRVISKADTISTEHQKVEIPTVGDFNIFKDGKQTIPLVAKPTIRVQGKTKPENKINVNSAEVPVDSETGLFQTEIYVSPGDKEIIVNATNPAGETTTYRQTVKVKDSVFFMVALAEEQLGQNFKDGNLETAGREDEFKDGFYDNGRLSYYLKGKLRGKFLVSSHYDTDKSRSSLFTNLDPDEYYPVYGDASTRDYTAIDTRQRLYFVVEMDKSYAKWGSFQTEFNDTELATYNRTLSGLKINYQTVGTTSYGDPKRGFKLFWSEATHRADHNEFASTGGTLYYLRNRKVIEGSEKIRIEVRDKIQGMTVKSSDLTEGKDYSVDYNEGRIMLSRPLSSVAASDVLISSDILDGNPVFLVVDYEFDPGPDAYATPDRGIRGFTHVGNHFRIGGTAVEEKRQGGNDYDLRGFDAALKLGRNTKITAEYATSSLKQMDQAVSTNGGLSFQNRELVYGLQTHPRESSYLLRGETKPVKNLEVTGYVQNLEPSFSNNQLTLSQQGTKKYGMAALYKFTDYFYARYRYDAFKISDQLSPIQDNGVTFPLNADYLRSLADNGASTPLSSNKRYTGQLIFDNGGLLAEAEYQSGTINTPGVSPEVDQAVSFLLPKHQISGKLGYHINDRLLPYVKVQVATDAPNHQFGGGVRYEVVRDVYAYVEQMVGNMGDSTNFGFERIHENGARTYSNIRMFDLGTGDKVMTTAIGSSFSLTPRSRIYSERESSTYKSADGYADILGYTGKLGDRWDYDAKFERRHLNGNQAPLLHSQDHVASGSLAYASGKRFRARIFLEGRRDASGPKATQWVTRNSLEYKVTQDLSFLSKLDYGKSRFISPGDNPADFMEFSNGFAFRPVNHDRLNVLTRYTYGRNLSNAAQFDNTSLTGVQPQETSHILALDVAYDLFKYLGIVEKVAFKRAVLQSTLTSPVALDNLLLAHRFNVHVTRKWDLGLEYRLLTQDDAADTLRHGALVEVDREFYDYARLGIGYNFTDFEDDLRKSNNFTKHGPFVRMTGKF